MEYLLIILFFFFVHRIFVALRRRMNRSERQTPQENCRRKDSAPGDLFTSDLQQQELFVRQVAKNVQTHFRIKSTRKAVQFAHEFNIDFEQVVRDCLRTNGKKNLVDVSLSRVEHIILQKMKTKEAEKTNSNSLQSSTPECDRPTLKSRKQDENSESDFNTQILRLSSKPLREFLDYPPFQHGATVGEHLLQPATLARKFTEVFLQEKNSVPLRNLILSTFDVETTGLGTGHEVVQIAAIRFNSNGEILKKYETLVRPGRFVSADAERVHRISNESLENQAPFDSIWPNVREVLEGSVAFAHNGPFDVRLIEQSTKRKTHEQPIIFVDTLHAYRIFMENKSNVYRLDKLAMGMSLTAPGRSHNALHDSFLTAGLVLALIKSFPSVGIRTCDSIGIEKSHAKFGSSTSPHTLESIPIISLKSTRPEFKFEPNVETFKHRFSMKNTRFFVDPEFGESSSGIKSRLLSLEFNEAKRVTPTVKYLFCTKDKVEEYRTKAPHALFATSPSETERRITILEQRKNLEWEDALKKHLDEQRQHQHFFWERAWDHYVQPRARPLNVVEFLNEFIYMRWG